MRLATFFLAAALSAGVLTSAATPARAAPADPQARAVAAIAASPAFKTAAATLAAEHERTVADIVTLTEIPAPPFKETERARAYAEMFRAHGLSDVEIDPEGNVLGLRKGAARDAVKRPLVVIAAHLDTVFPEGTDVTVRREGTKLMAPGVGDDTRSLAVLLAYVRALDAAKIRTRSDILFVGNVGEEGPGDLRGVRYLFTQGKYKDRIGAFFSMDGSDASRVVTGGVGSKRYRVTFKGPGGHSYGAFGLVNPMTAMAGAVQGLYRIEAPAAPRTTYSASVAGGGTSVNSIPNEVWTDFDMRSESAEALARLETQFRQAVDEAVAAENAARSTRFGPVSAEYVLIGDRPAGATPADAAIVRATLAAISAQGYEPQTQSSSTDSNLPMSLGIPAVTIGSGGVGGRAHALDEWIDVAQPESTRGMTAGLLALLAVAGVER
ncbi:MAG: M20/M25/M40 family metallo-hydrolase [Phenylobacterium sp.]|uniref:M20/M25/M40 family metallo-hydrolase n=1 Tax=Phenylobacterium sp. TaxID=1871053 RepID=UPI00391A048F